MADISNVKEDEIKDLWQSLEELSGKWTWLGNEAKYAAHHADGNPSSHPNAGTILRSPVAVEEFW